LTLSGVSSSDGDESGYEPTVRSTAAKIEANREFDRFVADHGDSLLRTAYLVAWDLGEAEDLVQECLLQVARRWPRVRVMEFPAAYARRILMNLVLDTSNHRSRRRGELSGPSSVAPVEHLDPAAARSFTMVEARTDLLSGLGELPPRQRAVLVLRYFEDLTEAQTAEALGCSIGTVKSTASHAIDRMRRTSTRDVPQLRIPAHVHKGDNR
jgi:RNA polymerase sigma-70 factor (sigma-E family)